MDSQFGLLNVWNQGDFVIRGTATVLLAMSLASWIVILIKALDLRRCAAQARHSQRFWHAADFAGGLDALGPTSPFGALAAEGRAAAAHRAAPAAQQTDALAASDWLGRSLRNSIDDSMARLQSGLAVLASVGSTAPFVGLFGTVWGIYHALLAIDRAGQASIDKVAGPIGEALIMTALGLAVAIPAVLGYNALVRGNKGLQRQLNRFGHDLHAYFINAGQLPAGRPAPRLEPQGR